MASLAWVESQKGIARLPAFQAPLSPTVWGPGSEPPRRARDLSPNCACSVRVTRWPRRRGHWCGPNRNVGVGAGVASGDLGRQACPEGGGLAAAPGARQGVSGPSRRTPSGTELRTTDGLAPRAPAPPLGPRPPAPRVGWSRRPSEAICHAPRLWSGSEPGPRGWSGRQQWGRQGYGARRRRAAPP